MFSPSRILFFTPKPELRLHTYRREGKKSHPASRKTSLEAKKKKNNKNETHKREEKKCVKVGRIKIAIKNTIILWSKKWNENKESRSFRTILERSLFTLESFFPSREHTEEEEEVEKRFFSTFEEINDPGSACGKERFLLSIVSHNSHPAVQAHKKLFFFSLLAQQFCSFHHKSPL